MRGSPQVLVSGSTPVHAVWFASSLGDGSPVRVTWVENDGSSTSRDLAPLDLSAGLVRAVDRTNAQIVTIALSRIAAVEPA